METKARTRRNRCEIPEAVAGRVAVVTGGSRGLGAAISGAMVIVNHHRAEPTTHVAEQIEAAGGKAFAEQCQRRRLRRG